MHKHRLILVAGAATIVGLVAFAWWFATRPESERSHTAADAASSEQEEWWVEPRGPEKRSESGRERSPENDPEWEARRERWREAWRASVDIAPLGPSAPTFGPDQVREALRPGRDAMRACVDEAGGFRAMREAMRAAREQSGEDGPRRRRVVFDVRPDGTVDQASIRFEPPMIEPYGDCFQRYFASARLPASADGARIELPLGPGRGRRFSGDGGVPWPDRPRRWRGDDIGNESERGR
jgi:hypothetical protein